MVNLRPYQRAAVLAVYLFWRTKLGSPAVVMPTGSGKTVVIAQLSSDAATRWGGRVLILSHSREIVKQIVNKLRTAFPGLDVGVHAAGLKRHDTQNQIVVAQIQTAHGRACELGAFDVVIIDECHTVSTKNKGRYRKLLADLMVINPNTRVVGFTATPFRLDSGPICTPDGVFSEVCYEVSVAELMRDGYLSPITTKSGCLQPDLSGVRIRGRDYDQQQLGHAMDQEAPVIAACEELVDSTAARSATLIFATSVPHARRIVETLQQEHGLACGFICGATPTAERDATLARFAAGELRFLCNVGVLTTGYDAPHIDCVVLLRPTMSCGLYVQMVGRGFRLHPGKEDCLVLDFGGNVDRHGPIDALRIKTERAGEGAGESIVKTCPECQGQIAVGFLTCPQCGHAFPPPKRQTHRAQATSAPILSMSITNTVYRVADVCYSVHHGRRAAEGAPPTMRVEYAIGRLVWQSEWVCIEHDGYARQKAELWWRARTDLPVPDSVAEAVEIAESGVLATPSAITVCEVEGDQFPKIVAYDFATRSEPQTAASAALSQEGAADA
ncbi:type I restriction enzyme EcoKI subunit R [Pirellulimonas nuda]|uniref:Type I restriction enzyme EcoKI subunit R n=1 Tax=Pirellulimonas nuda TaxID=2528009 RepID=A0A518D8W0_9BACT|nr:DEAD/DEAH box helicase [Pirellulimonas nuda]QDU87919.1 type I restriction enzyme EcoKI subunit R [Pirellulimonas nuda]